MKQSSLRSSVAGWALIGGCGCAAWLGGTLSGAGPVPLPVPTRAVIEAHVDRSINVHGHYAAVRLPVTHGVPLWNPTAVKVAADGTVFVANYSGEILRLVDTDGDGLEDTALLFADVRRDGLRSPTALALRGREVFVATAQEVRVYTDTDGDGVADQSRTFFKDFPWSEHPFDWTFGLTFDRDGWLNFTLSTDSYNPAPAPDPRGLRGALLRVSPDGLRMERVATGFRFAYGMAIDPEGGMFISDNEGGGNPTEELNRVVSGAFYGHNPEKYKGHPETTPPLVTVRHGFGMVGIAFNPRTNDFGGTGGDLFMAAWGPDFLWDRGSILRVHLERMPDGGYRAEEFPFAHEVPKLGDVTFGAQGDLYVAQFGREGRGHTPYDRPTGGMYRFIHAPWYTPPAGSSPYPRIAGDTVHGRKLFESLGCAVCHSVGGKQELLGPDLGGIGDMFSEAEVLVAIRRPSEGIKSGHETVEVELRDGETVLGRVLRGDEESLVMIQAGNSRRVIPRGTIVTNRTLALSLMPEGLINGCSAQDVTDLLAYLGVRRPTRLQTLRAESKEGFRKWRLYSGRGEKAAVAGGVAAVLVLAGAGLRSGVRRLRQQSE